MTRSVSCVAFLTLLACGQRANEPSKAAAPALRDGGSPDASRITSTAGECHYVAPLLPALPSSTCPAATADVTTRLAPLLRKLAADAREPPHITACAVGTSWIAQATFDGANVRAYPVRLPASGAATKLDGGLLTVLDVDGDGTLEPVTGIPDDFTIWFAAGPVRFEVPPHLNAMWILHDRKPALLVTDVDQDKTYNPLLGFSKVNSKAYTFTASGPHEQPSIVEAEWQLSQGAHCPGTIADNIGQFDLAAQDPPKLTTAPPPPRCDPAGDGDRRALLAAITSGRRREAAEKGAHDNYTSVEWLCRIDHHPTAWVSSQFLGNELWEQTATGPKVSSFGQLHDNQIVKLVGAADFDGDGSAQLIFAFQEPMSGPPYDTEIKARYHDRLVTIAHSTTSDPEPIWQVVRLPGGNRDALMFYAGTDWSWEKAAPQLIATDHGKFVDLPAHDKQFLIAATAQQRLALRSQPTK